MTPTLAALVEGAAVVVGIEFSKGWVLVRSERVMQSFLHAP
jgi:hypothetical protein